jgi:glycosyltransferase involved in cell wall biosynthesis
MQMNHSFLTIAIPTYKRPLKVIRLLNLLKRQIEEAQLQSVIDIIISDNTETDETASLYASFNPGSVNVQYFHQNKNLGFDGNLLFLYEKANTDYIWYLADDDFPLEGSIIKIMDALRLKHPDVLLFSFMQPPGSPARQFHFAEPLHEIQSPELAINTVISYPKLSVFVMRKVIFTPHHKQILMSARGEGWIFLTLSISVLAQSQSLLVAVFSEQLASADDDYTHIWVPTPFLWMHKIAQHPFIKKHVPSLESKLKQDGYEQCIKFSWALKRGILFLDDQTGLNKFIHDLEWRFSVLIKRPKLFLMLGLLKMNYLPSFLKSNAK